MNSPALLLRWSTPGDYLRSREDVQPCGYPIDLGISLAICVSSRMLCPIQLDAIPVQMFILPTYFLKPIRNGAKPWMGSSRIIYIPCILWYCIELWHEIMTIQTYVWFCMGDSWEAVRFHANKPNRWLYAWRIWQTVNSHFPVVSWYSE